MSIRRIAVLSCLAALAACVGRAPAPAPAPENASAPAADAAAGTPLHGRVGEDLKITLQSNRTTGYQWRVVQAPAAAVAVLVRSTYVPDQPVIPGSGGHDEWTFRATGRGTTTIVLGHFPPGGSEPAALQRYTLTVD